MIAGTLLFVYVLTLLAFIPRLEESQLFAALAGGVVGAILRDVFGMWTASTKAGADMAQAAMSKLPGNAVPHQVEVVNPPERPVKTEETSP